MDGETKRMKPDDLLPFEQEVMFVVETEPDKEGKQRWFRYVKKEYWPWIGSSDKGDILTGQIFYANLQEHIDRARRHYKNLYVRDVKGNVKVYPKLEEEE